MSIAALQAHRFYDEVAASGRVWTIRDKGGYPAPLTRTGQRSQPFWSSLSRVQKIIATVPAYAGFSPEEITWARFTSFWVKDLTDSNCLVGVNWSGAMADGYDIAPSDVVRNVESRQLRPNQSL